MENAKSESYELALEAGAREENERVIKHLRKEYYQIRKDPANIEISAILSRLIKEVKKKK
jgi:hypothetical protein